MDAILQLYERKSVRAYTEEPIAPEDRRTILNAALQAPTAGNMMLYTVLDITDPQIKDALAVSCDDQPFIARAPMVLVFVADYARWHRIFCLNQGENVRHPGKGDLLLAVADAVIAAQNAVVAAQALGLGSCYIGDILERAEEHRALLKLPEYTIPAAMLCIGHPTAQQQSREKPGRFSMEYMVSENQYPQLSDEALRRMVEEQARLNRRSDPSFDGVVSALYRRKYTADFSREMNRSAAVYLQQWEDTEQ
ncbi:MAG: nitroreductase family protein [Eubacteriales bacterium]|nr:nitroreductase family protein [Eubacteriales bacterium]